MEAIKYRVELLDGDYAHLKRIDKPQEESKLVARALLPESICEGSQLLYENLQYELLN